MSTITQEPPTDRAETRRGPGEWVSRDMWTGVAIASMWVAVALASIFGPDFKSMTAGGDSTTIPSGVAVALFASIASWLVAKHGFGRSRRD
jgi:hypothetical protein